MFEKDCIVTLDIPTEVPRDEKDILDESKYSCSSKCQCGYLQYESLIPQLSDLTISNKSEEDTRILEAKLRLQIAQVSRLFDAEVGVEAGHYSKGHYEVKLFNVNGNRYIKVPEFVKDSLTVYTCDGFKIPDSDWGFKGGYLMYRPCVVHLSRCGCDTTCGLGKKRESLPWPSGCYKVLARWGYECADLAVQLAVTQYIVEYFRVGDAAQAIINNIPVSRSFKSPDAWNALVQVYRRKKSFHQRVAIA